MYVCMVKLLLTRFGVRIESGRRSDERKIVGKIPMRYDNSLRNRSWTGCVLQKSNAIICMYVCMYVRIQYYVYTFVNAYLHASTWLFYTYIHTWLNTVFKRYTCTVITYTYTYIHIKWPEWFPKLEDSFSVSVPVFPSVISSSEAIQVRSNIVYWSLKMDTAFSSNFKAAFRFVTLFNASLHTILKKYSNTTSNNCFLLWF